MNLIFQTSDSVRRNINCFWLGFSVNPRIDGSVRLIYLDCMILTILQDVSQELMHGISYF